MNSVELQSYVFFLCTCSHFLILCCSCCNKYITLFIFYQSFFFNFFQSAQDERETLLLKQEDLNNQLTELRNAADSGGQEANRLSER